MHASGKLPACSGGGGRHGRCARSRQLRSALGRAAHRHRAAATRVPTCPALPPREAALAGAPPPPVPGCAQGGGGRMRVNESELNSSVLPRDPPAEGAPRRQPWVTSALAAILIFTIVVDLLGNLLVILSVYRNKKLRNAGNVFVVSLAVADLIVAIYPYPLVLTSVFHNGWKLGYLHCQISGFLMGLSVIGSIFNITGIAINRYCYICHSLKYDKLYSDKNSLCYIVLIWVLTFVAIVPNLFVGSLQYDPRIYSCTFAQSVSSAYTIAVVFFHFLLPIAIVTFCYLRIWILVIQVRRRVKPDNNPRLKPHDFRNFVTMFVVFVLFAVCWAPLNFIGLAVAVNPKTVIPRIPEWLFVSSYYMAYFNSCLNAIVYGLLNQNFRREYKRIIVTFCTAKVFFQDSSNDAGDRMRSKPSPLITNNNQVKVDSV
ncbi:melatonin receptor type 1A [Corvus cornix cornix]|uniref:melatonin receptor type 1A n=1 Tax=Corvus cornix cornix TaxID=932674 RepID=UPI00194E52E2|nr:melatonin receptor type 1A [Corvus cornix cornix]